MESGLISPEAVVARRMSTTSGDGNPNSKIIVEWDWFAFLKVKIERRRPLSSICSENC